MGTEMNSYKVHKGHENEKFMLPGLHSRKSCQKAELEPGANT